jgi:hypothetical protein
MRRRGSSVLLVHVQVSNIMLERLHRRKKAVHEKKLHIVLRQQSPHGMMIIIKMKMGCCNFWHG